MPKESPKRHSATVEAISQYALAGQGLDIITRTGPERPISLTIRREQRQPQVAWRPALLITISAASRMSNRYDIEGDQGSTQPDSGGVVLANKLGITNPEEMAEAELVLLEKSYDDVLV